MKRVRELEHDVEECRKCCEYKKEDKCEACNGEGRILDYAFAGSHSHDPCGKCASTGKIKERCALLENFDCIGPVDGLSDESMKWLDFANRYKNINEDFFKNAGHCKTHEEIKKKFAEIPDQLKNTAGVIINTFLYRNKDEKDTLKSSCILARHLLYEIYVKMWNRGFVLYIPHYWYVDGIMCEPELLVRMTNGIVGWVCDDSKEHCGRSKHYDASDDIEYKELCEREQCVFYKMFQDLHQYRNLDGSGGMDLSELKYDIIERKLNIK